MQKEVLKFIKGFEGIYAISNKGNLYSYKKEKEGFKLSTKNKKENYLSVVLTYKDKKRSSKIHTLVAESFIGEIKKGFQVNHKDMDKHNNNIENLEIITPKENMKHAAINKPELYKAMNNYNKFIKTKKIIQLSLNNNFINQFNNGKEASDFTGVCQRNILQVANQTEYKKGKKRSQAGGFIWKFI